MAQTNFAQDVERVSDLSCCSSDPVQKFVFEPEKEPGSLMLCHATSVQVLPEAAVQSKLMLLNSRPNSAVEHCLCVHFDSTGRRSFAWRVQAENYYKLCSFKLAWLQSVHTRRLLYMARTRTGLNRASKKARVVAVVPGRALRANVHASASAAVTHGTGRQRRKRRRRRRRGRRRCKRVWQRAAEYAGRAGVGDGEAGPAAHRRQPHPGRVPV